MSTETAIVITAQTGQAEAGMRGLAGSVEGVSGKLMGMKNLAGSLAGVLSIGAFAGFVKSTINGIDALNDMADATGASIENLSALELMAGRTGTSFDTVGAALVKFNQTLQAATPGSAAEQSLKQIGLNVAELKRLDPAEALRQTAVALNGYADDGDKARLVQDLFGKSVREVAPLLKDLAEQTKLAGPVTKAMADEADQFNKNLAVLETNLKNVGRALVTDLVTGINKAAAAMKDSGLIAGLQTLLTGDDEYKNNKRLVELTNDLLRAENALSASRARDAQYGDKSLATAAAEKRLAAIKAELQTVQSMRQVLEGGATGPAPAVDANTPGTKRVGAGADAGDIKAQNALLMQMAGLTASFNEDWERLGALYKSGKIDLEQLTVAQGDLLSKQPAMKQEAELVKGNIDDWVKYANAVIEEGERIDAAQRADLEKTNAREAEKLQKVVDGFNQRNAVLAEQVAQQDLTEEERILYKRDQELARLEEEKRVLMEHNAWTLEVEAQYTQARFNAQAQASAAFVKLEKQTAMQKQQVLVGALGTISSLMSSNSQELFAVGQAAAIANATIATYEGATKAIGQLGVWGIPVAAGIVAAGLAQVANIASTKIGGGTPSPVNATFSGGSVQTGTAITPITSTEAAPNAAVAASRQAVSITFQGSGRYTYDEVVTGIAPLLKQAGDNGALDINVGFA